MPAKVPLCQFAVVLPRLMQGSRYRSNTAPVRRAEVRCGTAVVDTAAVAVDIAAVAVDIAAVALDTSAAVDIAAVARDTAAAVDASAAVDVAAVVVDTYAVPAAAVVPDVAVVVLQLQLWWTMPRLDDGPAAAVVAAADDVHSLMERGNQQNMAFQLHCNVSTHNSCNSRHPWPTLCCGVSDGRLQCFPNEDRN